MENDRFIFLGYLQNEHHHLDRFFNLNARLLHALLATMRAFQLNNDLERI